VCGGARTSPRRWRSAPARSSSAGRTCTAWRHAGQAGVERVLEIYTAELLRVMQLLGVTSVAQLDGSVVQRR
jgi:isopentenyl diphosphate isomerase/L-lactate dehydrogenase-like FMN-dependent dehydrogenase